MANSFAICGSIAGVLGYLAEGAAGITIRASPAIGDSREPVDKYKEALREALSHGDPSKPKKYDLPFEEVLCVGLENPECCEWLADQCANHLTCLVDEHESQIARQGGYTQAGGQTHCNEQTGMFYGVHEDSAHRQCAITTTLLELGGKQATAPPQRLFYPGKYSYFFEFLEDGLRTRDSLRQLDEVLQYEPLWREFADSVRINREGHISRRRSWAWAEDRVYPMQKLEDFIEEKVLEKATSFVRCKVAPNKEDLPPSKLGDVRPSRLQLLMLQLSAQGKK